MPNILSPGKRKTQPKSPGSIDRRNPFGAKVRWHYNGAANRSAQPRMYGPQGVATDFQAQVTLGPADCVDGGAFTIVMVCALPTSNVTGNDFLNIGAGSGGIRFGVQTTGGGAYAAWTASGVANGADTLVDATAEFDMRKTVIVGRWTPSSVTTHWKRDKVAEVSWTDSIAYSTPADKNVVLGWPANSALKFYTAYIIDGDVGAEGARKLIDNPWQVYSKSAMPLALASGASTHNVTISDVVQTNTVSEAAIYTAAANGTLTSAPLKNNARTLLANISGWTVDVKNPTTGALVVRVTGLTTSALGVLTVQDALIITGQSYALDPIHATYGRVTPVLTAT